MTNAHRMPEAELQRLVAEMCAWLDLPHFHVLNSKGMRAGWPDCTIIGTRVIFRELKSEFGRLTPEQTEIGYRLKTAGADWAVWRARDWLNGSIEKELRLLKGQPKLPL